MILRHHAINLPRNAVVFEVWGRNRIPARVIGPCKTWRFDSYAFALPVESNQDEPCNRVYITNYNMANWDTMRPEPTTSRNEQEQTERWRKSTIKERTLECCTALRRYNLSSEELKKFRSEIEVGYSFFNTENEVIRRERTKQWCEERNSLDDALIAVRDRVESKHRDMIIRAEEEFRAADRAVNDMSLLAQLLTNEQKRRLQHSSRLGTILNDIVGGANADFRAQISPFEANLQKFSNLLERDRWLANHQTIAWWEQFGMSVARKRLQNGNSEMSLAEACDWFNLEASFAAIDIVTKRVEKKEAIHTLRVKAATLDDEKRQLAIIVKKGLESQTHILKLCPYCGGDLDLSIAHADHIFPISKGGLSIKKNMVYVCASCNIAKGSLTLNQFIKKMGFDRECIERRLELLRKDY